MVKFNFLAHFPVDHLVPRPESMQVLFTFCANLMHSIIMWLMVSSLSPHKHTFAILLHLIYSCFGMIGSYGVVLFYYKERFSLSLLRFFFLRHVQVFSCEILLICCLKRPWNCFSSHFCFLVIVVLLVFVLSVLFLVAVISLPARGVMVIVAGYGHGDTSSNPGPDWLHFT